ncbi:MAG: hypothetical protein WDA00_06360 [Eubacteriales bacterium]
MYVDKHQSRPAFFAGLYEHAKQNLQPIMEQLQLWYEQYKGSEKIDGSHERACAVRNITYEIIESQLDAAIPAPKVTPGQYCPRRDRNAKSVERLCAQLRDRLPFEELNDIDERYTYILGGSVWLVEWDSAPRGGENGGIRLSCLSPADFFPQPGIYEVDDMEYCFLRFTTTKEELVRRWQVGWEAVLHAGGELREGYRADDDTVAVILCYYKNEAGDVCRFVWSGELVLEDTEQYYRRKRALCRHCGQAREVCLCEAGSYALVDQPEQVLEGDIPCSDGSVIPALSPLTDRCGQWLGQDGAAASLSDLAGVSMVPTRLPYYIPKTFPLVVRKNTSCDKQLLGQSDCEFLRPAQQQINKIESRILQKLMRSAITPLVPEDAQITLTNNIFGQVIKLRPGERASDYGTVDTTPDISRDITQAERLYNHAKRIIGISDSYVGLDNSSISGYSRQLQLSQSAGRLESKRRMKHAAYARLDRIIFEHYLAYADEPRPVTYKDCCGKLHSTIFNRYDFLVYDPASGTWSYDDNYLFSVDLNGYLEGQRDAMWQKNLENLQSGTLGDPADPATLLRYWQLQERVHYPFARENVEYFQALVQSDRITLEKEIPDEPNRESAGFSQNLPHPFL